MQPAPATEQARFEAYYRLGEKAKQRDPDPEFAHRYYDEIVQAKWEGWQDRATQAERVQNRPIAMSNAEAAQWARDNGLNVPPEWEGLAERVQSSESIDTDEFRNLITDFVGIAEAGNIAGIAKAWELIVKHIDARRATASKAETAVACNAALRPAPAMPVDADARDAARYRWLRDSARSVDWSRRYVAPKATSAYRTFCRNHPQQMDDDIDVAIAANTKQGTP